MTSTSSYEFSSSPQQKEEKESSSNTNTNNTNNTTNNNTNNNVQFKYIAKGTRHSIGIDSNGVAYSWGRSNNYLGQLGRRNNSNIIKRTKPYPVELPPGIVAKKAYVSQGSTSDSGHSAIIDKRTGQLWMTGCDRWQQLGLGSSKGGTSGYTWPGGGKLWQEQFVPSIHIRDLMNEHKHKQQQQKQLGSSSDNDESTTTTTTTTTKPTRMMNNMMIRDVALGGDHTLILSSDQKTVYGFGKGGDGQLGLIGKPFVSAPVKSTILSVTKTTTTSKTTTTTTTTTKGEKKNLMNDIAAICAFKACSFTLDRDGNIMKQAGRCRPAVIKDELTRCVGRAKREGLIVSRRPSSPLVQQQSSPKTD